MSVTHLLNRELAHYQRVNLPGEAGGTVTEWVAAGPVAARVPQPAASERIAAMQPGAELTRPVYVEPDEVVERGDELRDAETGEVFRVVASFVPSESGVYRRLDTEVVQSEPQQEES